MTEFSVETLAELAGRKTDLALVTIDGTILIGKIGHIEKMQVFVVDRNGKGRNVTMWSIAKIMEIMITREFVAPKEGIK